MQIEDFSFDDLVEGKVKQQDGKKVEKTLEEEKKLEQIKEAEKVIEEEFGEGKTTQEEDPSGGRATTGTEEETLLLKYLKEKGYIEGEELEEDIVKDEDKLLEYVVEDRVNSMLEDLPDEVRELNKYVLNGGDLTSYLALLKEEKAVNFTKDRLTEPEVQKQIVATFLEKEGYDKDLIEDQIAYLEDSKKLSKFAEKYFEKYQTEIKEQKKLQLQKAELQRKEKAEQLKQQKNKIAELIEKEKFEEININSKDKYNLPRYMYDQKIKVGKGQYISEMHKDLYEVMQDPKKAIILAKLLKNKLSLQEIAKKAETQAVSKIEDNLTRRKENGRRKSFADYF